MADNNIKVFLNEKRLFKPAPQLIEESNVNQWMLKNSIKDYDELIQKSKDIEWFWQKIAQDILTIENYDQVLDWQAPYAKWFTNTNYNIVQDALDRHKDSNKVAYFFEDEPGEIHARTAKE